MESKLVKYKEKVQTSTKVGGLEKFIDAKLAKFKANVENMWQSRDEMWKSRVEMYQSREKTFQLREKMYQTMLALIILLVLFYLKGYNGSSSNMLM